MARPFLLISSLSAALIAGQGFSASGGGLPISREALAAITAVQDGRAQELLASLQSLHGVSKDHGFAIQSVNTDVYGQTHVSLQQTYAGLPVWGGRVLGSLEVDGRMGKVQTALKTVPSMDVHPALSASTIMEMAKGYLPKGSSPTALFRVNLGILPSSEMGGIRLCWNADAQTLQLDPGFSLGSQPSEGQAYLAYQVLVSHVVQGKGRVSQELMLDANTGALIRKASLTRDAFKAARGLAHTEFSGDQAIDTSEVSDSGKYQLVDITRPVVPHFVFGDTYPEVGNRTFSIKSMGHFGPFSIYVYPDCFVPFENAINEWGAGQATSDFEGSETSAADVHYGVQFTWDMLNQLFHRNGLDGRGGSIFAIANHPYAVCNAFWDPVLGLVGFGNGDGDQFKNFTSLDVVAHELGHGVMSNTADLAYYDESGGLNECNSDLFGTMAVFYANRPTGQDDALPEIEGNWTIGSLISKEPLRYMYCPSLDGRSYDAWFPGVGSDDVHFTSGIGNRFFYFLCCGTRSTDENRQSAYLPQGMRGIGLQKAAQIWYRAITQHVADIHADYAAMRTATLQSAEELFPGTSGTHSLEWQAVQSAWAAVNVGDAPGKPVLPQVQFTGLPVVQAGKPTTTLLLPMGASYAFKAQVTNAQDPGVEWSIGGLHGLNTDGGLLKSSGEFRAPYGSQAIPVKAASRQDPAQFAVTTVVPLNLDLAMDGDMDGCDLGVLALHYRKNAGEALSADLVQDFVLDDSDASAFIQAFHNAYRPSLLNP